MTLQYLYLFQVTVVTPVGDPLEKSRGVLSTPNFFFNVLFCVFSKQNERLCWYFFLRRVKGPSLGQLWP